MEPFRLAALASSSQGGNSYLIEHRAGTRLLVDCGVGLRRTEKALDELGIEAGSLKAILVTHEHTDHVRALMLKKPLAARYGVPVYTTGGTWRGLRGKVGYIPAHLVRTVPVYQVFMVGSLSVYAFPTEHDVNEPAGYVITDGSTQVAVATDLGFASLQVREALAGSEYLVLESNHDVPMLQESPRPYPLKRRIMGDRGHLSNDQTGRLLHHLVSSRTRLVTLAHLSVECNSPGKALRAAELGLRGTGFVGRLTVAERVRPSGWL